MILEKIIFGKPDITELEEQKVLDVLRSGWLGYGPVSKQLESDFSEFLMLMGSDDVYSVAVGSCTIGLQLCLMAEGIKSGDEVITSPLTFAATVNSILAVGAKPVFVDTYLDGSININHIEKVITKQTKAIIPVHLWGNPVQMKRLMDLVKDRGIKVIEDAAHGFGGEHIGKPLGTWGNYGVFSFYPTKNIGSCDGGMVVCKDVKKAALIRLLGSQGVSASAYMRNMVNSGYEVLLPGVKGMMTDVQAALIAAQLERWPQLLEKRSSLWNIYKNHFGYEAQGHARHLFTIEVDNRDNLRKKLFDEGIGTGVHYNPLHLEPAYRFLGYKAGQFPISETIGARTLSLPLSTTMTEGDVLRVTEVVKRETPWN